MLSASAAFATSDDVISTEASDEIVVDNDVLAVTDEGDGESSEDVLATNVSADTVTADTFFNYFDEGGSLLENVTSDELIFDGDFSDLDINYITINKPITFAGADDGAVFDGVTFFVDSDDVTINGFSITQSNDVYGILINSERSNIILSNNLIYYNALEGFDSYGIYAKAVDNLRVINNTITYVGNTDGTVFNNAVRIEGDDDEETPCESITFEGNTFFIDIPSVDTGYDPVTWAQTVYSEGIVFYYCEDVKFVDNRLTLNYNDVTTSYGYDTIYGVSVRSDAYSFGEIQSSDILIANNTIDATGNGYMYAVYVCADDFEVSGNEITSSADSAYACGVNIDGPSSEGAVYDNVISVEAPNAVYGIYSYQYMGQIDSIIYSNNNISADGYLAVGMEIVECDPVIVGNTIVSSGNYTYGIIASIRDEGSINGNIIYAEGSNIGSRGTDDSLAPKNSMGISVKGSALISGNTIESTNIGMNFVEKGGSVILGNIINVGANAPIDSYGIYGKSVYNKLRPDDVLSDLAFMGNTINFVGNTNGTFVNNAVLITGDDKAEVAIPAKNITFDDNTFFIEIPSVDVVYATDYPYASTVMSEGIVFYYCEDLEFVDNRLTLNYNDVTTKYGYDSLYAVSVKSDPYAFDFDDEGELIYPIQSKDIVINNNTIEINGHSAVYGITVSADGFEVSGNNVTVSSETYLAHGIDVAALSFNGLVSDNEIIAKAPSATYGIYSDGSWLGPVDTVYYINNFIAVEGYLAAGMELMEKCPSVINNSIAAAGNYTYGIIASIYDEGEITGNNILVAGSNTGSEGTGDPITTKNSMGISVKGSVTIANNGIGSTNIGINLVEEGDVTIDSNNIIVIGNTDMDNPGIIVKDEIDYIAVINNNISASGKYSVDIKDVYGTVNSNYLISGEFNGDRSVYSEGLATVFNNGPAQNTIISAADVSVDYGEDVVLVANVTNAVTGKGLINAKVKANINGKDYNAKTDANGQAVFTISGLNGGNYTAIIAYAGNDKYNPSSAFANVEVTKMGVIISVADVSVVCGENVVLVANVTNAATGNAVPNAHIVASINGKSYTVKSNSKGLAKFTISGLSSGNYTAVVSYAGNFKYGSASTTANVEVTKADTIISVGDVSISCGEDAVIVANVTNAVTGKALINAKVVATIDGKTYTTKTDANGQATFAVSGLVAGDYVATISYAGNAKYNPNTATANVEVSKADTIISAEDVSIVYGEDAVIVANLTNTVTGKGLINANVKVNIDGKDYKAKTDANGQAKFTISGLEEGNYTASITYAGNAKYYSSDATASVNVAKP